VSEIEAAEATGDRGDRGLHRSFVGDVAVEELTDCPELGDRGRRLLARTGSDIEAGDDGSPPGEGKRRRPADSPRCAGHQGDPALHRRCHQASHSTTSPPLTDGMNIAGSRRSS